MIRNYISFLHFSSTVFGGHYSSPFKLKEELGKAHENKVFFDQGEGLTTIFGITASPAFVVQDGLKLRIEEVLLND